MYLFKWLTKNLIYWFLKFFNDRQKYSWIITTTYTAGFMACLFKVFRKYSMCFYYQGNRIPPINLKLTPLRQLVHIFLRRIILILNYIFLCALDIIIVPSEYSFKELTDRYNFLRNKIVIVPNGIDTEVFHSISKK